MSWFQHDMVSSVLIHSRVTRIDTMEREMPEKDPNLADMLRQLLPYVTTLVLSCWGGFVSYIQRLRVHARKFSWRELGFDLIISSFAGLLTHLLCQYSHIDGYMSSVLIAISGHMGTRAIASFERIRDRVLGIEP